MKRNMNNDRAVRPSTGNVFKDLGLPKPGERLVKAQLMHAINAELRGRHLTQKQAAELVGLKQSELSRIANGRGAGFSTDRLIDVLIRLGRNVDICVSPADESIGDVRYCDNSGTTPQSKPILQSSSAHPVQSKGDQSAVPALQACIDHARDLIDSAATLHNAGKSNIAYHLATLALEEIGRRELLALQSVSSKELIPPAWPLKHTQNHAQKLFWAFFGAAFAQQTLTKESLEDMQGLARFIHARRLAGLYVENDDDGLSIPRDAIAAAEAQNLIGLVSARLGMAMGHELRPDISDADAALKQWFLATAQDDTRREFVFSSASMTKLGELKNARDWMTWLKQQFDEAQAHGLAIAQEELARSQHLPLKSEKQKWRLRIRLISDSHSIRPKALSAWNSQIDAIKLVSVPGKKHQLLVEFLFTETMPIESLWYTGWALARKFVVALNIGSRGLWWWRLPEHISRYYERIEDLQRQQPVALERNPRLKIDWGRNLVLTEQDLRLTTMCFAALPKPGEIKSLAAYDYYISGINFLSLNDIHWQCELQAYGNFHESLKAMMTSVGDWGRESPFDAALTNLLHRFLPTMPAEQYSRYITLARRFEANTAHEGEITLSDVGGIKILCDTYFSDVVGPAILKARISEADRAAPE